MSLVNAMGQSTFHKKRNIRILRLYGTEEEMAYQHGVFLKEEISKGAVSYLANKIAYEIQTDGPLMRHPILQKIALAYVKVSTFDPLIRRTPKAYKGLMEVMSKATGIPTGSFLQAAAMPDAMVILALSFGKKFLRNMAPNLFGCTSFVAFPDLTRNSELMYGRNLDFPVLNFWEPYSTVIYHTPKNAQSYVAITTAGVHVPGVTGYNESGLMLGIHQLFTADVSAKGVPIVYICSEVIKKATSIDEAIAIVKRMKRAGNWAIVLSSFKEKRAVVLETSPHQVFVRETKGPFITHSNHCFSPELREQEIFFNMTTSEDNYHRCHRLNDMCRLHQKTMDEGHAISLLGDHVDRVTNTTRSIGRTVSTIYNVQSLLFQPEKNRFYISTGDAPSNLTDYLELPWRGEDLNDTEKVLHPNTFAQTPKGRGMKAYARAYAEFSNRKDFEKAKDFLLEAIQYDPKEFAFFLALGFMQLKRRKFTAALESFEQCRRLELNLHEEALTSMWKGRTLDLLKRRGEAKKEYESYIQSQNIDAMLRKAFQKSWRRPYKDRDIDRSVFQFIFADFLSY